MNASAQLVFDPFDGSKWIEIASGTNLDMTSEDMGSGTFKYRLFNTLTNNNQLTNGSGYITASSSNVLTNKTGNISMWTNNAGYLTSEVDGSVTNEIELPSQATHNGKVLTTNGTSVSWSTPAAFTVPVPTAIGSGGRNFNQAYQVSSTRPTAISVSPSVAINIGVLGSVTGQAILEISANGTSGWVYIGEVANQSSTIGLSTTNRSGLYAELPTGYYWRLRTANTITGLNSNPTYTFSGGSEWVF